jgi:hypothetical protein
MDDFEVRDRDSEMKEKGKDYGDKRQGCSESDYSPGDKVLVKQHRENKLDTTFKMEPMVVKAKHGNSVALESNGTEYNHNVTHMKKYVDKPSCHENIIPSFVASQPFDSQQDLPVDPPLQTINSPKPCESESTSAELPTSV